MNPGARQRTTLRTVRPAGISRPALWLLVIATGAFAIAATTGAGWLLVLVAGLVGVVIGAACMPPALLRRVHVAVVGPRDARVGDPCRLSITLDGPRIVSLVCVQSELRSVSLPARGSIPFVPHVRGRLDTVDIVLESAAPLGLVRWRLLTRTPFEIPPLVAPRPESTDTGPSAVSEDVPATGSETRGEELQRGVREYEAGDPPRLIHWPASARTGTLMVREVEAPGLTTQVILVDLRRGSAGEIEHAVSRAFGLVIAALEAGACVYLGTHEPDGPRLQRVTTVTEAGRRLALTTPGPPPSPPAISRESVVFVTPRSDVFP